MVQTKILFYLLEEVIKRSLVLYRVLNKDPENSSLFGGGLFPRHGFVNHTPTLVS